MAAYTTQRSGNWSDLNAGTSPWTGAPGTIPTGGPGDGDTVTISGGFTVHVDSAAGAAQNGVVTIGSDVGNAIAINGSTGTNLIIDTSCQVKCKGGLYFGTGGYINLTLTLAAGAQFWLYPADNTALTITAYGDSFSHIICNGTSGNHCKFGTDQSRQTTKKAGYFVANNYCEFGPWTCTYTDFSYLGDTTHWGVITSANPVTGKPSTACSLTNCTFDHASYQCYSNNAYTWDNNYTFQDNLFTNSVSYTTGQSACAQFGFSSTFSGTYTRLVNRCGFDAGVTVASSKDITFTNNVSVNNSTYGAFFESGITATSWTNASQMSGNLFVAGGLSNFSGNLTNNYFLGIATQSNPYAIKLRDDLTAWSVTNCIFEAIATPATGDWIFIPANLSGPYTLTVKGCISLPAGGTPSTSSSGKLISCLATAAQSIVQVVAEHNTVHNLGGDSNQGIVGCGENNTGGQWAGVCASARANIAWCPVTSARNYVFDDAIEGVTPGTEANNEVTVAGYNGFWNPATGTCYYNTGGSQVSQSVVGYRGARTSNVSAFPNTVLQTDHDVTVTANPFFDSTRNIATWYASPTGANQTTTGSYAGDAAAAITYLLANPSVVSQAGSGLLAWVRAGFRPTATSFKGASYSGDALSTDAAGNAWGGGSTPDIGAMAWVGGGILASSSMDGGMADMRGGLG